MKAIILSAGQGKRLSPLTDHIPKCLLEVAGKTMLEWQVDTLLDAGIDEIVIVTGYGTSKVESLVKKRYPTAPVRHLYNPDYATSDNLISCWKARDEMCTDFLLLNGDTLFEPAILATLLECEDSPITVTINSKDAYDPDDMKVQLQGRRLLHIGKKLPLNQVDGEAIGIIRFMGDGPSIFRNALDDAVSNPGSAGKWYLSVIEILASKMDVMTCAITGLRWCEVDFKEDLMQAEITMSSQIPHRRDELHQHQHIHQ